MSFSKRNLIPTPATCTEDTYNNSVQLMVDHYRPILTPELLVANRKGCYGLIINTVIDSVTLENTLGSENAKTATEQTLYHLTVGISTITTK